MITRTLATIILFTLFACSSNEAVEKLTKIRIGLTYTADAVPLVLAEEKGFFISEGLTIELVPFHSDVDRDTAFRSQHIDGMAADLVGSMLLKSTGDDLRIIALTIGSPTKASRVAILASPTSQITAKEHLRGREIAISSNSVIEFITDELLRKNKIDASEIQKTVVPKLAKRLDMLLANEVSAATLPDPLARFAEQHGAVLIVDNEGDSIEQTVLAFHQNFLSTHSPEVKKMLLAYNKAVAELNTDPELFSPLLAKVTQLPEDVQNSYEVIEYPEGLIPSKQQVDRIIEWIAKKGISVTNLGYKDFVTNEYQEL